ncbi:hypothetical protein [Adlercreutzia sp. ZJ141]|uniref:hypothetical protein n=1 Tax=Adlercreutzia sp. ZJ141 TaxID=2709406 RepID=UPI0013EAE70E|nr:hypothetical protein [Adlercreutzia sp. ZJ141]
MVGVMILNGAHGMGVMGDLNLQSWNELRNGSEAETVGAKVRRCARNCWMVDSVSPAMSKNVEKRGAWAVSHKLRSGKKHDMCELKVVCDYETGRVFKEESGLLSICDNIVEINDGLTAESRADAHIYKTEEAL